VTLPSNTISLALTEDVIDKGMELAKSPKSPNYETDEAVLEYWDEFMAHVEGFNEKQKK